MQAFTDDVSRITAVIPMAMPKPVRKLRIR